MRPEDLSPRQNYVDQLYAQEDAGLQSVRARLVAAGRWGVNIGANEGVILQILLRAIGAKKIVEIGTLFGYSTVWMARALADGGHVFTLERDPACATAARQTFQDCKVDKAVTLLEGEAITSLAKLEEHAPYDIVFIDANKSAYVEYLEWATRNTRKGGLIIADNTFLGGHVLATEKPTSLSQKQWREMRKFNELIADRTKYHATILPTTEGLTIALKL